MATAWRTSGTSHRQSELRWPAEPAAPPPRRCRREHPPPRRRHWLRSRLASTSHSSRVASADGSSRARSQASSRISGSGSASSAGRTGRTAPIIARNASRAPGAKCASSARKQGITASTHSLAANANETGEYGFPDAEVRFRLKCFARALVPSALFCRQMSLCRPDVVVPPDAVAPPRARAAHASVRRWCRCEGFPPALRAHPTRRRRR